MVDLKRTKKEMKEDMVPIAADQNQYPWGTRLRLDTAELHKLGIDTKDLQVGASINIMAKGEISSVSSSQNSDGGSDQYLEIQITDLCIDTGEAKPDKNNSSYRKARKDGWGKPA